MSDLQYMCWVSNPLMTYGTHTPTLVQRKHATGLISESRLFYSATRLCYSWSSWRRDFGCSVYLYDNALSFMASSVSAGCDWLWLELSCSLRDCPLCPARKVPRKPYNKSFFFFLCLPSLINMSNNKIMRMHLPELVSGLNTKRKGIIWSKKG